MPQIIIHAGPFLIIQVLRDVLGEKQKRTGARMQGESTLSRTPWCLNTTNTQRNLGHGRKEACKLDYSPGARQGETSSYRSILESRFLSRPIFNAPLV